MENRKLPFFMYQELYPIMIFEGFPIDKIYDDIFAFGAMPYMIIKDKNHPIFIEHEKIKPKDAVIHSIVLNIRPLKQYFA